MHPEVKYLTTSLVGLEHRVYTPYLALSFFNGFSLLQVLRCCDGKLEPMKSEEIKP